MTALLNTAMALILTQSLADDWNAPTPEGTVQHGLAAYYQAPNLMAQVAANRGLIRYPGEFRDWLNVNGYVCAVALNRAGDLGRVVWIQPEGGKPLGPCISIDCSQLVHYQQRLDQNRIVDVDYRMAMRWAMRGPVPVTVWFTEPTPNGRHQPT